MVLVSCSVTLAALIRPGLQALQDPGVVYVLLPLQTLLQAQVNLQLKVPLQAQLTYPQRPLPLKVPQCIAFHQMAFF